MTRLTSKGQGKQTCRKAPRKQGRDWPTKSTQRPTEEKAVEKEAEQQPTPPTEPGPNRNQKVTGNQQAENTRKTEPPKPHCQKGRNTHKKTHTGARRGHHAIWETNFRTQEVEGAPKRRPEKQGQAHRSSQGLCNKPSRLHPKAPATKTRKRDTSPTEEVHPCQLLEGRVVDIRKRNIQ
ncbi:hypothetical protein NDU88_007145 [Pleurodeles waltl]|uniref:Uncharacterized protein n=1 Tax=Pleurodeles waltl TaxID=8319 RepID=A0AAV7N5J4_PLEWA|nr:hypothetical protein NDU88_007145 [Pleurodeles waltl]